MEYYRSKQLKIESEQIGGIIMYTIFKYIFMDIYESINIIYKSINRLLCIYT